MSAPHPPSDWQCSKKLLKERGQHLFETGLWSDCSFIVGTEPDQQEFKGHKLFLAMSSPVFEVMFFGAMPEKDSVKILDIQPDVFKALLTYIYTDKYNFTSFDQVCELWHAAKKYMFPHLVNECIKYLSSKLNLQNVCCAYKFAKLFEEPKLMDKSLSLICSGITKILSESNFDDLELNTIITIFDQHYLNINSEMELFSAISRYATRHNQNLVNPSVVEGDIKTDGPTIRDALKKIRFLTFSPQQFAQISASCNFLTDSEKSAILMNIRLKQSTPMPPGFSRSTAPRNPIFFSELISSKVD